jgi:VanZ family protein
MPFDSKARLIVLLSATTIAAIGMASLLPTNWVPRTGLGWQVEHFLAYFTTTIVLCVAWRRPFVVAVSLIMCSGLLEAVQGLTPDRLPDLTSALCGTLGAISAAMLVKLLCVDRRHILFSRGARGLIDGSITNVLNSSVTFL